MKSYVAQEDVAQWIPLVEWLARPTGPPQVPPGTPTAGPETPEAGTEPPADGGGAAENLATRTESPALVSA